MWSFYRRSIRRMPRLAVEAVKRVDTLTGWLTIIVWMTIGGTAAGAWWQGLPWQVPAVAVAVFFGYGFLRAVYQEHLDVEGERNQERERLREANTELQARVAALEAQPRTEAEELKHSCLQLGTRLGYITEEWVRDYHEAQPCEPTTLAIPNAQIKEEIQGAKTDQEKQRVAQKLQELQSRKIFAILDQAQRQYERDFRERIVKLLELAEARG